MPVHASGNHLKRALTQALVQTSDPALRQWQFLQPSFKKDISCGNRLNRLIQALATSVTHGALPASRSIDTILGSS
jgi:hypothetical protein